MEEGGEEEEDEEKVIFFHQNHGLFVSAIARQKCPSLALSPKESGFKRCLLS